MKMRLAKGAIAIAALGLALPAQAQYFGRNPVQWERLKFEVLKTDHFDIHYYPEEKKAAEEVGRMGERWYARYSRILGFDFTDRQPVILYASSPHFQQTNAIGGSPGEGTGGVTEAFKRRIVLPVGGSLAETDHVFGHELVHAFQYAMTGQGKMSSSNYPSALNMPLWFIEGMAEYLSVGPVDAHTAMWLRDAARKEKLPRVRDLTDPRYFPYRYGQALWAYIGGRYGDGVVGEMLRHIGPRTNDPEQVLKEVLGVDEKKLTEDWHAAIRDAYGPAIAGKQLPATYGPALVTEKSHGGNMNVGPALSPDGGHVAFLSERDLFSIELFVADTKAGSSSTSRLSHTAVDSHLQSIQFINSSGSWDRSGVRFALGAVANGRPVLEIIDAKSGNKLKEVPFPKLGEVYTPSFSPDGNRVVFAALANGFTDLFVYDLSSDALKRLTEDEYADLQPTWSPDGKTIAFVTDRFTTNLDRLAAGNYQIALLDVDSGDVRPFPTFDTGKSINPQWAPTGKSLYFVSDATGFSNVYRKDLASGEVRQLTDLLTGVSGITALSPALSSAANSDKLAYSVYDEGRYDIYTISDVERLAGWPAKLDSIRNAAVIPGGKPVGAVVEAKADATTGLEDAKDFQNQPYKPKLGLDFVGQPYVTAGVDRYGSAFGGGVSMSFSDMLGEHSLDTMIQANSIQGFTDLGFYVSYVNRVHRFNWGAQIAQVPYITGGFGEQLTTAPNGQLVYQQQTLLQRQLDREAGLIGFYPFSSSMRLEVQSGVRRISFDSQVTTDSYDYATGQLIGTQQEKLPSGDTLTMFDSSAALVRDTSVFGATSPILGQRFRLQLNPVVGTINYTGVLADFRQYFMPFRPLTIAFRLEHYGRYGSGGEDPRMYPLYIGYQSLVRGYDTNSFNAAECGQQTDGSCPVYDQLLGSRMLVGNVEARIPLFALFGAKNLYGPLPIEVGGFFDAGVAWDSHTSPKFSGSAGPNDRTPVKSYGATARLNLLGFAVLQLDYAKPIDRPGKSAFFQFNLLAGF